MGREIIGWGKAICVGAALTFLVQTFIAVPVIVSGDSMKPTLENRDRVLISKLGPIENFDMIVFKAPDSAQDTNYVKRVIGIPGDEIKMVNDKLFINGKEYKETYLKENKLANMKPKLTQDFTLESVTGVDVIPEGYYFVLGDNRDESNDSRYYGLIKEDSIIGFVAGRFSPLDKIGMPN